MGEGPSAQSGDLPSVRVAGSVFGVRPLLYLGNATAAAKPSALGPARTLSLAHLGRHDEVEALLSQLVIERPGIGTPNDGTSEWFDTLLLEASVVVEHREAARALLERLRDSRMVTTGVFYSTVSARHLGGAAALLGDRVAARGYCEQALAVADAMPFRPETALTHLQLAELLTDGDEQEQAAAIPELRDMQMQPGLEQALRLRERLSPPAPASLRESPGVDGAPSQLQQTTRGTQHSPEPSAERRLVTVLFTDIVGSTKRAAALGDRAWRRLKAKHHATVRQELARFGGHEVDTAGDGFFVTFDGPARAVECARAIRDAVRTLDIEIRAGLHTGEVELQDGGVSGITVHIGARVGALAAAGEVLVTRTVRDLVAGSNLRFTGRGEHSLPSLPIMCETLELSK